MPISQVAIVPGSMSSADINVVRSEIQQLAAALQVQVSQHFGPAWGVNAAVSAFSDLASVPSGYWMIIVKDQINDTGAAGYHMDDGHQPYALVQYDPVLDNWTTTTSHELLELLADPWGNRLANGTTIDPNNPNDTVQYLVEVCDPVQNNTYSYTINNIAVSNFVYPAFFGPSGTAGPYDYRNASSAPLTPAPGGSLAWQDLTNGNLYQVAYDDSGKPTYSEVGSGTFSGGRPLREIVDMHFGPIKRGSFPKDRLERHTLRRKSVRHAAGLRAESIVHFIAKMEGTEAT